MNENSYCTNKEHPYPYLEKTANDLQGEVWKDVLDYEGFYQVSSLGRVRSLDRVVPHPRLHTQFVKGRMLVTKVNKDHNIKTGEPMISLQVSLSKDGKQHYTNIRRLVYQAFVDPALDYGADSLYIINIDGNGYNNCINNLKAVTRQVKSKRVFERERIDSYLKIADRSLWTTNGGIRRRKPIDQFDLDCKLVGCYLSVSEAAIKTGIDSKYIIGVAKGRYSQWNGFIFKYQCKL